MAIDDNTSYELTGAQVKDLANKIKAKAADNIFIGATSAIPGSKGLVPAPQAGDDTKFLSGDGLWKTVSQYSLPIASSNTLGGIKVGNNLTIDPSTGVLDADGSTYTAGNGIDITNDVISIDTSVVAELSDIPTVNDATLTIQKNGTNVATFTSNSATNTTANISVPTDTADLTNGAGFQTASDVATAVGTERTAREAADVNLQGQIDAITASSDVTDIVGTKAELNNYDTSTLGNNDIIKVLQDESMNGETTYYRWSTTTQTFTLIGEEGPYYTKSQTDTLLNAKANISDVHDATLTITQNGTSAGTFTANSSTNTTIALTDTTYTAGNHIDITNDVITAEGYIWGDTLTSATTPTGTVTSGMIADGTIQASDIATGVVPVITMTDTDPGEGSPLAANHFIAVYGDDPSSRNYSTSETFTGATWIDGKPIYRRVFSGTITTTANQDLYKTLWANSGVDALIKEGGWFKYGDSGKNPLPMAVDDTGNIANVYLQNGTGNITLRFKNSTAFTDRPYQVWIEYTKSS